MQTASFWFSRLITSTRVVSGRSFLVGYAGAETVLVMAYFLEIGGAADHIGERRIRA
jgi:hypothetical protein